MADDEELDGAERGDDTSNEQLPHHTMRDPRELRAFAHPLRLRLMNQLGERGKATATELSEAVGASPSNCSWHLRQLARYGIVEEVEGAAGRQRPWRLVPRSLTIGAFDEGDPELFDAQQHAVQMLLQQMLERLHVWERLPRSADPEWKDASYSNASTGWLTVEELSAMTRELDEVYTRHIACTVNRVDSDRRPPGSRMIHSVMWVIPGAGPDVET